MFQRIMSLLLCTCLIIGSVPETAAAASMSEGAAAGAENAAGPIEESSEYDGGASETETTENEIETGETKTAEEMIEAETKTAEETIEAETETAKKPADAAAKTAEEEAVLKVESVTYKSAQIRYEIADDTIVYGYYEPQDKTGEKKSFSVKGAGTQTLYGLKPETEYRIWLENVGGDIFAAQQFTTEALTVKTEYQTVSTEDTITIDAKVSEYDGDETVLYLYVSYMDADGKVRNEQARLPLSQEQEKKAGSAFCKIEGLLENTEYAVTMWVQEGQYINTSTVPYAEQTKTIKTTQSSIKPDSVKLTIVQNASTASSIDCTASFPAQETRTAVKISCRQKGQTGWYYSAYLYAQAGQTTVSTQFDNLKEGVLYEVRLELIGRGIRKDEEYQYGKSLYKATVSDDTDTLDSILSYQLSSENVPLKDSQWYVTVSYMEKGDSEFTPMTEKLLLTGDDYRLQIKTGDYVVLVPDKDYTIKWKLYKDQEEEQCYTLCQEIHTKKGITITNEKAGAVDYSSTVNLSARTENLKKQYLILRAYIRKPGESYKEAGQAIEFLGGNGILSGTLDISGVKESTTYEVSLREYYGDRREYFHFSFHTQKDDRTLKVDSVKSYMNRAKITCTLSGESAENSKSYIIVYYREKGCTEWERKSLLMYGTGSRTLEISDYVKEAIRKETVYEYVIGIGKNANTSQAQLNQTVSGEFETLADDRKLSAAVTTSIRSAEVELKLSGKAAEEYPNYMLFYYREQGTETEYEKCSIYQTAAGTYTYTITQFAKEALKENTVYEYIVGLGENADTLSEELTEISKGEFTTKKDERTLQNVRIETGYGMADVKAELVKNTYRLYTKVYFFYREKGAEAWNCKDMDSFWEESKNLSVSLGSKNERLSPDTVYEYAMVFADADEKIASPDAVTKEEKKTAGEFVTKKSGYTLELVYDEAKSTYNKAALKVSALGSSEDSKLYVTLTLDNGQKEKVTLSQMKGYENTVAFTGLQRNTTYKVTKAELSVTENSCQTVIDTLTPNVSFTTKDAKAPTQITLSKTELFLNVAEEGEGICEHTLKAYCQPEDAAEDVIWESSDKKVAAVKNGKVTAVSDGTAVITVKSAMDETVFASCNVTVKSYVVAENVNGVVTRIRSKQLYKGDSLNGLGLYEQAADGTLTRLEDFSVVPAKRGIVKWNGGVLTGTTPGTTGVIFEKNGVQAVLTVNVSVKIKGFGIVGLISSNSEYPAILTKEGSYELACIEGVVYRVKGEISPTAAFHAEEFDWVSSDETVAVVENGVITPKKKGTAVITVTPKGETSPYVQERAEISLDVRDLPTEGVLEIYTLTNQKKNMVLADVAFPKGWEDGWQWKEPQTKLYSLPVNKAAYPFEAVYTGTDKYEAERTVNVYIGTITGIVVSEIGDTHNNVIQVSGSGGEKTDQICLKLDPAYTGALYPGLKASVEAHAKSGIGILEGGEADSFVLTASKKGNFTLKTSIQMSTGEKDADGKDMWKTVAKSSCKIKAVTASQAYSIELSTATEGVRIDEENGRITFDWTEETETQLKDKEIVLNAVVKNRDGKEIDTVLEWKSADTGVAVVKYAKKTSHQAAISIKGDGHTVLRIKAKDQTGYAVWMSFEIRNHRPRVDKEKVNLNTAYDYTVNVGRMLAEQSGGVLEIAEVYNEAVDSVTLYKEDGTTPEERFKLDAYSGSAKRKQYLLIPVGEEIQAGTYHCQLAVKTESGENTYFYPLEIKAEKKAPKVTVKMSEKINLFYLTKTGTVVYQILGSHGGIEEVTWESSSKAEGGFEFTNAYKRTSDGAYVSEISHQKVKLLDGQLAEPDVAVGTLQIKLSGIRQKLTVTDFKIRYHYKKPVLKTVNSTTSVSPDTGNRTSKFKIYDNLQKRELTYSADKTEGYCYSEIRTDSENVTLKPSGSYVYDTYSGSDKKETFTAIIDSNNWRESLEVKHTVKRVQPRVILTNSTLCYNKAYKSELSTRVRYQYNAYYASLSDLEIKGANAKAQALTDKGIFEIALNENSTNLVEVKLNQAKLLKEDLAAGTYTFYLIPYYNSKETGEKTELNTLKLKLKVADKEVKVKITPKGTLDLGKSTQTKYAQNSIVMQARFTNLGDGCQIVGAKLKGEYHKYFKLVRTKWIVSGTSNVSSSTYEPDNNYYLKIADYGKLKAGHTYRLSVEYTVRTEAGDEFKVESNVFKVKPKQTAPKVTIQNNNQTMYAASGLFRCYTIQVPEGYSIESVYGSLDCNKDGRSDVIAYMGSSSKTSAAVYVTIVNADAVTTGKSGKSYSIPVTVTLKGRDGISKDAKAVIKVKIKR